MSGEKGNMGFFQFGITIIALVLAFFVGRMTATGGEHTSAQSPHDVSGLIKDAPEVIQNAETVFAEAIKDRLWSDDDEYRFRDALAKLGRDGQLKQLAAFTQAVNSGQLKLAPDPAPPSLPACCNLCTGTARPNDQGAALKRTAK